MSVVINTNVDALKIQNILTNSTSKLSQSMQRMASGMKINSAADDAAGTVISARMNVQLNGNQIAQKNVQNANAMLSTAEGNLDVVLDNVTRIRDLTLQAKNGTYSSDEINAMQAEIGQRIEEIDRVSESAKYSQLQLFGGDIANTGISFQVGANATDNDVIEAGAALFKSVKFADIAVEKGAGTTVKNVAGFEGVATSAEIATAAETATNVGKVYYNKDDQEFQILTYDEGRNVVAKSYDAKIDFSASSGAAKGDIYTSGGVKYVKTGADTQVALDGYKGVSYSEADTKPYEAGFDISTMTADELTAAVNALDNAVDNITSRKSQIGSLGTRLESALNTLNTQYTNLSSAKSIITDADIASEASKFTQNQILQQVSTSLLAQANQAPSIALSLL